MGEHAASFFFSLPTAKASAFCLLSGIVGVSLFVEGQCDGAQKLRVYRAGLCMHYVGE